MGRQTLAGRHRSHEVHGAEATRLTVLVAITATG